MQCDPQQEGEAIPGLASTRNLAEGDKKGRSGCGRRVRFANPLVTGLRMRPRTTRGIQPSLYQTRAERQRCIADIGSCPHFRDLERKMEGHVGRIYHEGPRRQAYVPDARLAGILRRCRYS